MKNRELYPLVGVDVALFSVEEDRLKVLLVKRAQEPERQRWALPGGMLKPDLDGGLEATAKRVLSNKVSVEIPHLEEVCTFSGPSRDPRGWSVSVLFYALLPRDRINALVKNKVEALKWDDAVALTQSLAFDHDAQLQEALLVLQTKVERHGLPLHLMPELFTLSQLQKTCEVIMGRDLDKSVFRRRLKGSPDLVETDEFIRGLQRPAQMYRACDGFKF